EVVRTLGIEIPPELVLLVKTVLMAEGLGVELDPSFQLTRVAAPLVRAALRAQVRAPAGDGLRADALDALYVARRLPARLRRLGEQLDRGTLAFEVRVD